MSEQIVVIYDYEGEDGALLFQVRRDAEKNFHVRRPDGRGGWIWNLDGVRRVLFRLPQLLAAVRRGETIYVVEGEKDVLAVEGVGGVATCNPGGAGKWRDEYREHLRGVHVVVVADEDEAGHRHAEGVRRSLAGIAASVEVKLPAVGNDIADHLAAGRTLDELLPEEALDTLVAASSLVADLKTFVSRFVRMRAEELLVYVLWLIHTHAIEAADCTPYMVITSPTKGCGKTTAAVRIPRLLARGPQPSANVSSAALHRILAKGCTFLLDEADGVWKANSERGEEIRTILNGGYSRGEGDVIRCVGQGSNQEPRAQSVFGAKAIAGIGRLVPDTVLDRGFAIRLQRAPKGSVEKLRERRPPAEAADLRERMRSWAAANETALRNAEPLMPGELDSRGDDIAEPLIAIADLLGCGDEARHAIVALRTGREHENSETTLRLLADIQRVFVGERMGSNELLDALVALEGSTWAAWWGDERDRRKGQMKLARMLDEFDIRVQKTWLPEQSKSLQGYRREQFESAWATYLTPAGVSGEMEDGRSEESHDHADSRGSPRSDDDAEHPTSSSNESPTTKPIFRPSDLVPSTKAKTELEQMTLDKLPDNETLASLGATFVPAASASTGCASRVEDHASGGIGEVDIIDQTGADFDDPTAAIAALGPHDKQQVSSLQNCGYEIAVQAGSLVVCRDGHKVGNFPGIGK